MYDLIYACILYPSVTFLLSLCPYLFFWEGVLFILGSVDFLGVVILLLDHLDIYIGLLLYVYKSSFSI